MIFITETGSSYEVDQTEKCIRRLRGRNDPTPRQGKDGEWKHYKEISPIELGFGVMIIWTSDVPLLEGSDPDSSPATFTSNVVEISV